MDNLTKEQRRRNMQNIRSKGTMPEKMLSKALRLRKIYFAQNVSSLIGKPDFVFRKKKIAVFVDSDFWHGHPKRFIMPKTGLKYWRNKIKRNTIRDKKVNKALRSEGWKVIRLWEWDIRENIDRCIKRIVRSLSNMSIEAVQDKVKEYLKTKLNEESAADLAKQLIRGCESGLELEGDLDEWFSDRFVYQSIWLDKDDYLRAITRALPQALVFAATDFGQARQRDLGQLWTDTARGFLGEIAFKKFLEDKLATKIELDITMDKLLKDYISSDVKNVIEKDGTARKPKLNVSVKTGKFNARWLDEYGAGKFEPIDVFVFVRVGTWRQHFVSFLKSVSFLKDKLLPAAQQLGELTAEGSNKLWDEIPGFEPVPAYISGFLIKRDYSWPIHDVRFRPKKNRKGEIKEILFTGGIGIFTEAELRKNLGIKELDPNEKLQIMVDGIQAPLTKKPHFYASTGLLQYGSDDWEELAKVL